MRASVQRQRGSASMLAIVWALLLTGIAVMAGSIATSGNYASALRGLGERASLAAQSGLQWGEFQSSQGVCLPTATFSGANALPGHADMTVVVSCSSSSIDEGGSPVTLHHYSALACSADACPAEHPPQLYGERRQSAVYWR